MIDLLNLIGAFGDKVEHQMAHAGLVKFANGRGYLFRRAESAITFGRLAEIHRITRTEFLAGVLQCAFIILGQADKQQVPGAEFRDCLLYTSDAADE